MITALFAVLFGLVGVGLGFVGAKMRVASKVDDDGEFTFKLNENVYSVTKQQRTGRIGPFVPPVAPPPNTRPKSR